MKTIRGTIILEDSSRFSPGAEGVTYTDVTEASVFIPYPLLIRLYEGARHHIEHNGLDWERFCDGLFEKP